MLIGEVSQRTGFPTSTLRYYERIGLLPRAERVAGRRRYTSAVLERLTVIELARSVGFSLDETKRLFLDERPYSSRLRSLAAAKLAEVEAIIRRAESMKDVLRGAMRCRCVDVAACSKRIAAGRARRVS